ncbi:MAG: sulfatase-like hydrolase/transferase [Rubripirellula sp.]
MSDPSRITTTKLAMAAVVLASCLVLPRSVSAENKRPNILFIVVDDQSPFDLKVYRPESKLQTPNIDRLAAEGTVFDAAYHMGSWSGAVCTPSRHMIMSGRTLWHLRNTRGRQTDPNTKTPTLVPKDLPQYTMPAIFNRAGYETMRTCKNGNSYEAANQLFTVRRDATRRGGTDDTGSAWHAEQVLDYLNEREAKTDRAPFLIYFGFSHPHDTRDGKPELLANYGAVNHRDKNTIPPANPKQPVLPPNYLPAHPFDNTHMGVRDEINVSGVWKNRDERTIRNELGREYACNENIDIQIGRVLDKLRAMGELDNTYIFYTADHGMAIGRHGLQGKQNLYEHTWRIPMIVKGPDVKKGVRVPGNVYLLDVLSTMCDLTGLDAPKTSEGISFKSVLQGKQATIRSVLYGAYSGGAKPGMRSVRKGDWKLIKYDSTKDGVQETQLFNLAQNPNEYIQQHHTKSVTALIGITPNPQQTNLAADTKFADKLDEMEALLLEEMRRLNDPYRLWNQPNDGLIQPPPKPQPQRNSDKIRNRKAHQSRSEQPINQ